VIVSVVSRDRDYSLLAFPVGYRWITVATGLFEFSGLRVHAGAIERGSG